jgi:23S rRNA pseudouridine1911/1915/1917 synthase
MSEKTTITADCRADRLDKYLAESTPHSRSYIKNAILAGRVCVNGSAAKPDDTVKSGDVIDVWIEAPKAAAAQPEDIPVDIVYEDADIAVVNKPQGMVVHPAPGHADGTLVNALLFHLKDLSGVGGEIRPGIVHRIDKDTSGLLVVAKNDAAHISLSEQIAEKSASRIYEAIVHGNIKADALTIDKAIGRSRHDRKKMGIECGGRDAVTKIRVLERFGEYTYIEAALETGRTHQIRVHLASIKRPVAGDPVYGPKKIKLHGGGQLLHAKTLVLRHPKTGEQMIFHAPLPDYFERVLRGLRGK